MYPQTQTQIMPVGTVKLNLHPYPFDPLMLRDNMLRHDQIRFCRNQYDFEKVI